MSSLGWIDYVEKLGPTIVALAAAIVVMIGWCVNSRNALNNEIEKEARQYKIEMCMAIIKFHKRFSNIISEKGRVDSQDTELIELFDNMMDKVLLYGGNEEFTLVDELAGNFEVSAGNAGVKNIDEAMSHHNISVNVRKLLSVTQKKLRNELRLEHITEQKINDVKKDTAQ